MSLECEPSAKQLRIGEVTYVPMVIIVGFYPGGWIYPGVGTQGIGSRIVERLQCAPASIVNFRAIPAGSVNLRRRQCCCIPVSVRDPACFRRERILIELMTSDRKLKASREGSK